MPIEELNFEQLDRLLDAHNIDRVNREEVNENILKLICAINIYGYFSSYKIFKEQEDMIKKYIDLKTRKIVCMYYKHLDSDTIVFLMSDHSKSIFFNNGRLRYQINKDFYTYYFNEHITKLLIDLNENHIRSSYGNEISVDSRITKTNILDILTNIYEKNKIYRILDDVELRCRTFYLYKELYRYKKPAASTTVVRQQSRSI